jgi:TIR domain-containing protein
VATIRQYFELDFNYAARYHGTVSLDGEAIKTIVLYDFSGGSAFLACYVPRRDRDLAWFLRLLQCFRHDGTIVTVEDRRVTLPSARQFHGRLTVSNQPEGVEILANYWGDTAPISSTELSFTKRLFIYAEDSLSTHQIELLKTEGRKIGRAIQFRSETYVEGRTRFEKPVAFVCHDSRDKDEVAREIAIALQGRLVPVWYDEFSLNAGDDLRKSIEKGLNECKKCIMVLSKHFFSNEGWTKNEFEQIYLREINEKNRLIIPVWYKVSVEEVRDYCAILPGRLGLEWDKLGPEETCRRIAQILSGDDVPAG